MQTVDPTQTASIGTLVMLVLRVMKDLGIWPKNKVIAHVMSFIFSAAAAVAMHQTGASVSEIITTATGAALTATGAHEATQALGDVILKREKPRNKFMTLLFGSKKSDG